MRCARLRHITQERPAHDRLHRGKEYRRRFNTDRKKRAARALSSASTKSSPHRLPRISLVRSTRWEIQEGRYFPARPVGRERKDYVRRGRASKSAFGHRFISHRKTAAHCDGT